MDIKVTKGHIVFKNKEYHVNDIIKKVDKDTAAYIQSLNVGEIIGQEDTSNVSSEDDASNQKATENEKGPKTGID